MFNNITSLKHPYLGCDVERNKSGWPLHAITLFTTRTATKVKKIKKGKGENP